MKKTLLFSLLLGAATAQAQITTHDIAPDTTVNTWNAFTISPMKPDSNVMIIWWHPTPEVVVNKYGNIELLFDAAGNYPAKLNAGDDISSTAKWTKPAYHELSSNGVGNWTSDATDKYLAFRVKPGATWHYGWLKMSVATGAASFTVKEWAYNSVAEQSIKAGQTSTTGINSIATTQAVNIYPNPAKDVIHIQHTLATDATIQIINTTGQCIKTLTMPKDIRNPEIEVNALPAGYYSINMQEGSKKYSAGFVKQ